VWIRVRFAVGLVCVAAAVVLFAQKVPNTVSGLDASVRAEAYITDPVGRQLTSGDILGISRDLQAEALAKIPPRSKYALLLPANEQAASAGYGIGTVAYETVGPWLNYLLLPSYQVSPEEARYVICWGCDTSPWDHRTTWLYGNGQGVAIGRVRGR
jgi:hypothetical protein